MSPYRIRGTAAATEEEEEEEGGGGKNIKLAEANEIAACKSLH